MDQLGGSPTARYPGQTGRGEKEENRTYWKAGAGYDRRWVVEYAFPVFKKMFGEHLMAPRWEDIVREVMLKVSLYNRRGDGTVAGQAGGAA